MKEVLQKQNELKEAFDKYQTTLLKVQERRLLWTNETKNIIINTLTSIQDNFKMRWRVQRLEDAENYQTINICMDSQKSGIVEKIYNQQSNQTSPKSFIKHGGYLAYCQSYNGKINVIIGFPYIDEWVLPMDTKVIATIEPTEVTEELISNQVIKFLQTMEEWEGKDRQTIGFRS